MAIARSWNWCACGVKCLPDAAGVHGDKALDQGPLFVGQLAGVLLVRLPHSTGSDPSYRTDSEFN